jgi:hypothetical protein
VYKLFAQIGATTHAKMQLGCCVQSCADTSGEVEHNWPDSENFTVPADPGHARKRADSYQQQRKVTLSHHVHHNNNFKQQEYVMFVVVPRCRGP